MKVKEIQSELRTLRKKYEKYGYIIYENNILKVKKGQLYDRDYRMIGQGFTWASFLIEKNVDNITNRILETMPDKK